MSKEGSSLQKYLSPDKLKELTVKSDPNIMIIDVRPESSYKEGHIPEFVKRVVASIILCRFKAFVPV